MRYSVLIDMPKAYLSGVCVMRREGTVQGTVFNEFGVTSLSFHYDPVRQKVRLHYLVAMMDKWYIRRVLRRDLLRLLQQLEQGETRYENTRQHITYVMTPIYDTQE